MSNEELTADPFAEVGIDREALAEFNTRHMLRPPEPDEDVVPGSIREKVLDLYRRRAEAGLGIVDFREALDQRKGTA